MSKEKLQLLTKTKKTPIMLGIESSCDETSAAIVSGNAEILSNIVVSQFNDHSPFGGVVPELAARAHIEHIDQIVSRAMTKAQVSYRELSGVAATAGPGLIGGVLVGSTFGKSIALANNLPFLAINHLEGHALTARLTHKINFPFLLFLASGGHCQILAVSAVGKYKLLGSTIDDAIGEAFDKTAKLLDLGFPGGPALEKKALNGNDAKYTFPKPMFGRPNCNFSFSGLKTAVRYKVRDSQYLSDKDRADIAASFQKTVCDVVKDRCSNAISIFQLEFGRNRPFVVAGGVAANQSLRMSLYNLAKENDMNFIAPPAALCTDNAAMIAWVGIERLNLGHKDDFDFMPKPRWPLD